MCGVLVGRAFFLHDPVPKIDLVFWFGCFEDVNLGGIATHKSFPPFARRSRRSRRRRRRGRRRRRRSRSRGRVVRGSCQ